MTEKHLCIATNDFHVTHHQPFQTMVYLFCPVLISLFLLSCTRNYQVEQSLPTPIVEKLPLVSDIVITNDFSTYIYSKEYENGITYNVEIGKTQERMFTNLFNNLLSTVYVIREMPKFPLEDLKKDIVIKVTLDDFEVATPEENGLESHKVSVLYGLSVYTADGKLLGNWIVPGYGRDRRNDFLPFEPVVEATKEALRDAATLVAAEFTSLPEIQATVCVKTKKPSQCRK